MAGSLTNWSTGIAGVYDFFQARGASDDFTVASEYAWDYRVATLRLRALIAGDNDPVDNVKYGPIGSAVYSATKHAQFTVEQAKAFYACQHYMTSAGQKQIRALYAALAVAGIWLVESGAPVFNGAQLGEYAAPLAIGALALSVYNTENNNNGNNSFKRRIRRADSKRDPYGFDVEEV